MDESRKAFESWFNPRKIAMQKRGISTIRIVRLHKKMLEAWNTSRAAIEIKLPSENELHQKVCSECASESLEMVEQAIRAAGIKVKE